MFPPHSLEDDTRFEIIVNRVLENEGSALNDNPQTGELSQWGISLKFLKNVQPDADRADIASMTKDEAKAIYRQYFWQKPGIWQINNNALAYKVMDLGVNMGMATSVRLLQEAVGATIDGVLGPISAKIVNEGDQEVYLERLKDLAEKRYRSIAAANIVNAKFLDGWLARLEKTC